MRRNLVFAAALGSVVIAAPALSQAQQGEYGADLSRMIADAAAGTCSADIMAPQLLSACEAQIGRMAAGLSPLGGAESITLVSAADTPQGKVETYRVRFANGYEMNWSVGARQDGKYAVAFTTGG